MYFKGTLSPVRGRIYLDECIPAAFAALLSAKGFAVTSARHIGMAGKPDECQLEAASDNRCVLVTYDHDFAGLHATHQHSGIVIGRPGREFFLEFLAVLLSLQPHSRP